jgi:hypothetical protein
MNFLAHTLPAWGLHLDAQAWAAAGTSVPDWMRAIDRSVKLRPAHTSAHHNSDDAPVRWLCWGIERHHSDDHRFHLDDGFTVCADQITADIRAASIPSVRASVLGHIAAEMLMDAVLLERHPWLGERYYAALESLDGDQVQRAMEVIAGVPLPAVPAALAMFCRARFLLDYRTDDGWWRCLLGAAVRTRLGEPAPSCRDQVATWRAMVAVRMPTWIDDDQRLNRDALASGPMVR